MMDACAQNHLVAFLSLPSLHCAHSSAPSSIWGLASSASAHADSPLSTRTPCVSPFLFQEKAEKRAIDGVPFPTPFPGTPSCILFGMCVLACVLCQDFPPLLSLSLSLSHFSRSRYATPHSLPALRLPLFLSRCVLLFFRLYVRVFCSLSISLRALYAFWLLRRVCHSYHV